jgi:FkbM family methyltransferase
LDIGAYDGKTFSNSLALLEKGWSGVLVEPSPSVFLKLMENTKGHKVDLVNCAITPYQEDELRKFFDSNGDALSSFVPEHVDKWVKGYNCKFTPYYIMTCGIQELCSKFATPENCGHYDFQFLNLDVEGLNVELIQTFERRLMSYMSNLKLICVEHDSNQVLIEELFRPHGFRKIMINGENLLLGR